MNTEFSTILMKNDCGSLNYQARNTEIFAGFSIVLHGRHSIDSAKNFIRQEYYDGLIGAGTLYFAPSLEVLDSESYSVDTHLICRENTSFAPSCQYDDETNSTTVNVVARYFVMSKCRFNPDYMYQCLRQDFNRLIGKQDCISVACVSFSREWFAAEELNCNGY